MIPIEALAQRITVEGIVTDSNGEPIIGATVIEKGNKTNGVVTDLDGKFLRRKRYLLLPISE